MEGQTNTDIISQAENSSTLNEVQVTTTEETTTETVSYTTTEFNDEKLGEGITEVRQVGVNGTQNNTYEVTYTDGVETSRNLLSTVVTTAPIEEIIAVGVKDVNTPVIDASSIQISTATATDGQTIRITANITDNKSATSAEITYLSPITGSTKIVSLYKNETSDQFEGTLTVDSDTELGAWTVQNISASDASGNESQLNSSTDDLSVANFTVESSTPELLPSETAKVTATELGTNSTDSQKAAENVTSLGML